MAKKRKKQTSQATPNPSNEIQISDILESTPAPPLAPPAAIVDAAPSVAMGSVPTPPVSRPALTAEKAAELLASEEQPAKAEAPVEAAAPEAPVEAAVVPADVQVAAKVESEESTDESKDEPPASEAPVSEAAPSTVGPKKKKKKKRVSRTTLNKKIDRLEAKLTEKKEEAAKAARAGFESNPLEDETSVPPVDSEVHDDFFAAGEKGLLPPTKESGAFSAVDARHAQKMTPHAHARRAHLSRYVMWTVGGAAALLLLAVTIRTVRGRPNDEPVRREVTHVAQASEQPQQAQAVTNANANTNTTVANNAPQVVEVNEVVGDPKKDDTQAETGDAKAPEVAETAEKKEEMPAETPKTAYQEKQAAKAALERGSNGAAIAAGERSVALDPSDGEAWLVLGGAYQALGNNGQAKRCYKACVSEGKKGPVSDCRDMLGSL